jgi:CheY-like chemotaxis protein
MDGRAAKRERYLVTTSQKTILVIEDNELNLKLVLTVLKTAPYHAVGAKNAVSGIRLAQELIPDLILMDINLPGMDGISAAKELKNDPETKDIPIIAVTGLSSEEDKKDAINAGCRDFITKPISIKPFLKTISKFFDT